MFNFRRKVDEIIPVWSEPILQHYVLPGYFVGTDFAERCSGIKIASGKLMQFELKEITDPAEIEAIGLLRVEIWRSERPVEILEYGDSDSWIDSFDHDAFHWGVYVGSELIAAARLSIHDRLEDAPYAHIFQNFNLRLSGKVASINRLVVKREFRGNGISKILDRVRLDKAKELGATAVLAMPLGETRARGLMRIGYEMLASEITPTDFDMKINNAKLAVLVAPLNQFISLPKVSFKEQATELR